ncbi:hypothetical protein PM082_008351 [Marasmius tenuissimus]|nr:hypothetical protein PM082_008351 [Marasmius tenuissimus]
MIVESDEEDEYNPLEQRNPQLDAQDKFELKIAGSISQGSPLLAVFGDAGKYWAKGANLGEQHGAVFVNDIQVGLIFKPTWTKSTIVVSETFTRLPIHSMNAYGSYLVSEMKPSRQVRTLDETKAITRKCSVSILDVYPSPTYISPTPILQHEAPIRYLCSAKVDPKIAQVAESFAPPNLLHSTTSSALLAHIVTQTSQITGTLILLPSARVTAPPPKTLQHSDLSNLDVDGISWSSQTMNGVNKLLLQALGENSSSGWTAPSDDRSVKDSGARKSRTTIGEGGMYI